jgi:hypothetical protein
MLYKFSNYNKHGNIRTRIIPWPTGKAFGINPKGLGGYIGVSVFKYEYTHELNPPGLMTLGDKKYIMPGWQEVLPETELNDIKWIKPKVKRAEVFEHKFKSSSNDKVYTTKEHVSTEGSRKYTCSCPGSWMAKDKNKGCKHQQQLMSRHLESKQMKK